MAEERSIDSSDIQRDYIAYKGIYLSLSMN